METFSWILSQRRETTRLCQSFEAVPANLMISVFDLSSLRAVVTPL
ncbi:MAG: hypothetical protein R3338_04940 [Thermoanaerobaculia bacterium]|nr:hypothetical protein [Thermoanaerobaculia bacterium]